MDRNNTFGSIFERVNRGAALLDAHFGSRRVWASKVDLERLDISDSQDCILGQVFNRYGRGVQALGLDEGQRHGFAAISPECRAVESEWRRLLDVPAEPIRLELTRELITQLAELSLHVHDTEHPLAVVELDVQGVRIVLV